MNGLIGIGELARRTGIKPETIRYYEQEGLVPKPGRSEGGHRRYGRVERQRLIFVRRARQLGFTLDEVRQLLSLSTQDQEGCSAVREMTEEHIRAVQQRITDLQRLETNLRALSQQCGDTAKSGCPIVAALTPNDSEL